MSNHVATYDYLTEARYKLFDWVRPLSNDDYRHDFGFALGTIARTLTHIMICEWYYVQQMLRREIPPYAEWPIQDETPPDFAVIEETWRKQAPEMRASFVGINDWNELVEFPRTRPDGTNITVSATQDQIATQLALHEVHHRAQAMAMLRMHNVPAEDLDYNAFVWRRRVVE